jgi:Carboxypeptidase regulatory-like domain
MVSRKCWLDSTWGLVSLHHRSGWPGPLLAVLLAVALAHCGGSTTTVHGTVTDGNGQPFPAVAVLISSGSFKQSVLTDAKGSFSVANVPTPYDATVLDTGSQLAIEFQGLTRADPTLFASTGLAFSRNATLDGQLSGGNYPEPPGYSTAFLFSSPETQQAFNFQTSASYSLSIGWSGAPSTTGSLYVLQIHSGAGPSMLPVDYPGYGTLSDVALHDQGTLGEQNIALAPVTQATLSGAANFPAGYSVDTKSFSLLLAPGVSIPLGYDFSAGADFTYTTPSIPGTSVAIAATANSAAGEYIGVQKTGLANASGVVLSGPVAPSLSSPMDAATGVGVTTPFSWTAYAGGVHVLFFYLDAPSGLSFIVFTAATTATLPDLASLGFSLPASARYGWHLSALAPVTSVDAVAAPRFTQTLFAGDYTEGVSVSRSFTTGP